MGNDTKRYLENWDDELNGVALYEILAGVEKNPKIAEVYRRLAANERGHVEAWAKKIKEAGGALPVFHPSWRTHTLGWMAKRFGVQAVLPTVATMEQVNSDKYAASGDAGELVGDEQSHARLLKQITGGMQGSEVAQLEGRHRTPGGNALRAAVLGASDGLLSNMSLVMGVVGADLAGRNILVTGLAGLLAGAFSMGLGEWLSVQSSRELFEKQIRLEKEEIAASPEEEVEELALIYQARGIEEKSARQMAKQILSNRENAIDTLAREELGIDPAELGGSAWEAAIASFFLFAIGAAVPVIAFALLQGTLAIVVSLISSAIGLFVIGAFITLFTGRSVLFSGMRQVIFGLLAAAITFGIGRLLGVNLGG